MFRFALLLLISLCHIQGALFSSEKIGLVLVKKGEVTALDQAGKKRDLSLGSELYLEDLIETGRDSVLQLTLIDNTTLTLSGKASFQLKDYLFQEDQSPKTLIEFAESALEFLSKKIANLAPENFLIETDTATIGIRG